MSSSSGVETSRIVVSSTALTRCTVPGGKWNAPPGPTISLFSILSPGPPSSTSARPERMYHASSLTLWNWRLSDSPALRKRVLPTYRSVLAQISS